MSDFQRKHQDWLNVQPDIFHRITGGYIGFLNRLNLENSDLAFVREDFAQDVGVVDPPDWVLHSDDSTKMEQDETLLIVKRGLQYKDRTCGRQSRPQLFLSVEF
eukprot:Gregarina_sp_Poly_1__2257@NODE_15_length_23029_cov_81_474305_g13_i0_p27_GENE_NODE_15_length_23029_cov_81_474305_g13_i0NODE_15_length_23029_cov_81_474305_g13_i0_p27_ORF_typecomplete_len104_score13_48_NODE_15_length_23029_cov_81_474305_g13_i041324443